MSPEVDRENYLEEKINALTSLVDDGYGQALLNELMIRLEGASEEFIQEAKNLLEQLRQSAETQEELLDKIKKRESTEAMGSILTPGFSDEGMTEWEKKLASLEGSKQ